MENAIVFDIETKKTFDEVGGFDNAEKLGVSYVGLYSYSQDKLFGFFEDELPTLEKIIVAEKPTLIGFNSIKFDNPVLQPYFSNIDLSTLPHIDLLKEIEGTLGHRVKLDSVASATLYSKKSGDGLDAIRWYREGDYESLAKYCLDDVRITRDVFEFGQRHGKVYFPSGGEKREIAASWAQGTPLREKLFESFKKHEQVTIDHMAVADNEKMERTKHTIEILSFENDTFEAYSHTLHDKKRFHVYDVWDIEETGNTFAHQGSLF